MRVAGRLYAPDRAVWDAPSRRLTLRFTRAGVRAVLVVEVKSTHVIFELAEVQPTNRVELVLWGPHPTTISNLVGEVVGVVRDAEFAIGLQALNARTLGGYPANEHDVEPEYTADDPGDYPDLPPELKIGQIFRGDTARRTEFGSVLQAYCRQRDRDRLIANWGHDQYLAPAFPDGGVRGSRIALFACPAGQALETIGAIEVAEGLLARAAGFDAGFALAASLASTAQLDAAPDAVGSARQLGAVPAILAAVKEWETARLARVFPPDIKAALRDNAREFHLRPTGARRWDLFQVHSRRLTLEAGPAPSTALQFTNLHPSLPLHWTLRSACTQAVAGLSLEINHRLAMDGQDRALPPGGALKYEGGAEAVIYDATWNELARVPVDARAARVAAGSQQVKIGCSGLSDGSVKIELRTLDLIRQIGVE